LPYKATSDNYTYSMSDGLDLHDDFLSVLYMPQHYDIIYSKKFIEKYPEIEKYANEPAKYEKEVDELLKDKNIEPEPQPKPTDSTKNLNSGHIDKKHPEQTNYTGGIFGFILAVITFFALIIMLVYYQESICSNLSQILNYLSHFGISAADNLKNLLYKNELPDHINNIAQE